MRIFSRTSLPADVLSRAALPAGERVLASAQADGGTWLLGTRGLFVLLLPDERVVLPWEAVEDAAWDKEEERLRVTGIGEYGRPKPSYTLTVPEPSTLIQLIRERVTASVVLQRRVPVRGRLALTVIGRRSPVGGPIRWMHSYDAGLDPDDPEVVAVAEVALLQARGEVGEPI